MLDKILVPLDGSELADRILTHVQRFLCRADAQVILLEVVPESAARAVYPPGENALALARKHVEKLRDRLIENGAQARARVVIGDPATKILEIAQELDPALMAMSTHGRSGVSRFIRGSVAERVLREAKQPVLLANPRALPELQTLRIKKILVPIDGSELSASILPLAEDVATLFQSELVLLYTREPVRLPGPTFVPVPVVSPHEANAILERLAKRVVGVPVRVRATDGPAASAILDVAETEGTDLVAMTTHGRSGVSRWAFGSVAEHVVRQCPCPILVKRTSASVEAAGEPQASTAVNTVAR